MELPKDCGDLGPLHSYIDIVESRAYVQIKIFGYKLKRYWRRTMVYIYIYYYILYMIYYNVLILYYMIYLILYYTSSTAQGGGGSFKNGKPIGEVGCCESGMAERIH